MILFIFHHFNFPNHSMNDTRYFYQSFIKPRWAARLSAAHGSNQVAAVMRTKWRPDELCAEAEAGYDIFRYPVAVNEPSLRKVSQCLKKAPTRALKAVLWL